MSLTDQEIAEFRNLMRVNDIVRRSENPHPMTMVIIIAVVILVMYCIYVMVIKVSIAGKWIDDDDENHVVQHNKWTDIVVLDGKNQGVIKGNAIFVYVDGRVKMGVVANNKIKWMNGDIWHGLQKRQLAW